MNGYENTGWCRCGRPNIYCDGHGETMLGTTAKFRKKPVEIEAGQWDGSRESIDALCRWVNAQPVPPEALGDAEENDTPTLSYTFASEDDVYDVQIWSLEGPHLVSPGDWIIKGVKGEFYACKPDIFEMTYDRV
jgi:hypothetical protein